MGIAYGQGYTRIMDLIALAVPFFLLSIAIEWSWGRWCGRDTYRLTDAVSSLTLGGLSQARRFVALGVGGAVYAWLASVTPFTTWTTEGWQAWLIAFVLYDLCYYCSHRAGHEVKLCDGGEISLWRRACPPVVRDRERDHERAREEEERRGERSEEACVR